MFSSAVGLSSLPGFPYIDRQCFGAAIGIFISVVVLNLRHFRGVFRIARHRTGEDSAEPIPYRFALWGIVGGLAILFIFSKRIGMSLWLIPLFFAIYFIIVLVLTRMRAEQGFPVHAMENMSNHHILIDSFGTRMLGTNNLVAMTLFRWFNRSYTSNPMPHQLEGFKLSERSRYCTKAIVLCTTWCLGVCLNHSIQCYSLSLLHVWCFEHEWKQQLEHRFRGTCVQRTSTLAILSYRTEFLCHRRYCFRFTLFHVSDVYAGAVLLVAFPSDWVLLSQAIGVCGIYGVVCW